MAKTKTRRSARGEAIALPVPEADVLITMAYLEPLLRDAEPRVVVAEGFQSPGPIRALAAQGLRRVVAEATREAGPPAPWQWRAVDRLGVWICYGWWESTVPGQPPQERFRRRRLRCVRVGVWDSALTQLEWQPLDEETDDTRPFFDALRETDGRGRVADHGRSPGEPG